jgi:hypothetical protein
MPSRYLVSVDPLANRSLKHCQRPDGLPMLGVLLDRARSQRHDRGYKLSRGWRQAVREAVAQPTARDVRWQLGPGITGLERHPQCLVLIR